MQGASGRERRGAEGAPRVPAFGPTPASVVAELLKDRFGPDVPVRIADMVGAVQPGFDRERFLARALAGYEDLELTPRARQIADALGVVLPDDPESAMGALVRSLGPTLDEEPRTGMAAFLYLPHAMYVADHGLGAFDAAMAAQHAITQRFTCEGSIRVFIDAEPERTLAVLEGWTADASEHVRRLVSEGTRPRLPWAPRLRRYMDDPRPVLALLERLRDDPSEYVRRSVANNLNDISKDNPVLAVQTAERWMRQATPARRRTVRHGLRGLLKAGDPGALAVLGFAHGATARVVRLAVEPGEATIGDAVEVRLEIANADEEPRALLVDLRVHFVKATGTSSPKVFKLRELELAPGERAVLRKRISVRQHSTRTHYPGTHRVEVMVNGVPGAESAFELRPARSGPEGRATARSPARRLDSEL